MVKKALLIPDCHIPYQDQEAYDLMLWVAQDAGIDEVVILGDFLDFYGVNSHGKDPGITETLQEEITAGVEKLIQLKRLFPHAKRVYIEGNHEHRLGRYIASKCPDLYGVVDVYSLLELRVLGFEFVPFTPDQQYHVLGSKLVARHCPLSGGEHCAAGTVKKALTSVIFGHTHRIQEAQVVSIDGKNYRGISNGWLGDKNHPVMSYVKNHHQWAQGFSIVTVMDDGTWFNQLIHIIEGRCHYNGYIYSNRSDDRSIREAR
jgi:predicted phosphodiesterase